MISTGAWRNRLLAGLSNAGRGVLQPHLESVGLEQGDILERSGEPVSQVHFVESGLVSIVGTTSPNHRVEVGMIGYEGMTGIEVLLGNDLAANELLVQTSGWALRIATPVLCEAMRDLPMLKKALLNYVYTVMVQGSQTVVAAGRGRLDERLARWLLMWHDRVHNDEFVATHEFLALLLGVRRQGITVTLHELEGKGLIRAQRGRIRIIDRPGLLRVASDFYGIPESTYERTLGVALTKGFHSPAAREASDAPGSDRAARHQPVCQR